MTERGGHGLTGVADAGAFLARLTRFDPAALVRLRRTETPGRTALWARLPWRVLVGRTVSGPGPGDATVSAAELLTELNAGGVALPPRRDADWRWPLPPSSAVVLETLAAADVRQLAAAAAGTLRTAAAQGVGGRAVGQRALRDALLDHVAVVVTPPEDAADQMAAAGSRVEVPQRLVQAVARMGFLGPDPATARGSRGGGEAEKVQVRLSGRFIGLAAPYGVAWLLNVDQLAIRPAGAHTNG